MDSAEFAQRLQCLSAEEIERLAVAVRADHGSAERELAWWRATIEVSGALRRNRRSREASMAAHRAATAVVAAAEAAGLGDDEHRGDVTAVARAAAEAARLLVLDGCLASSAGATLLHPWLTPAAA